jgi:hypothetical protein
MPANTPLQTYFEAFNESYDAFMDAVQSGAERGYRLSTSFLTEAQRGQHETLELGRTFVAEPTSVRGTYRRFRESADRRRARLRELGRQVIDELAHSRTEARETVERIATQQRVAEDATVQLAHNALNGIIDRAQARLQRTLEGAESGRRAAAATRAAQGNRRDADARSRAADIQQSKRRASERAASESAPGPALPTSSDGAAPPGANRRSRHKARETRRT